MYEYLSSLTQLDISHMNEKELFNAYDDEMSYVDSMFPGYEEIEDTGVMLADEIEKRGLTGKFWEDRS